MNRKMILYITGIIALLEAGLMALPAIVALIYQERSGIYYGDLRCLWRLGSPAQA